MGNIKPVLLTRLLRGEARKNMREPTLIKPWIPERFLRLRFFLFGFEKSLEFR